MRTRSIWVLSLAAIGLFGSTAIAQDNAAATPVRSTGYDLQKERTVVGTVVSFDLATKTPPFGAHVVLQTTSGTLDVHLGNATFLQANHFSIKSGDTLRIIGENVPFGRGSQFVARIVQNGTQALPVRSISGMPLSHAATKDESNQKQGGVL
jgi:hypothetical protein